MSNSLTSAHILTSNSVVQDIEEYLLFPGNVLAGINIGPVVSTAYCVQLYLGYGHTLKNFFLISD